jgi:tRNA 2-selenouridine synthase SelU
MKVSTVIAVAFATMAAAAPAREADQAAKATRVEGINLTGMTEKEMQDVIARMKQDPEIQAIMESINGTSNEDKMAVMNVAKKGLAYNNAGILGPFRGRARYVMSRPRAPIHITQRLTIDTM